MDGTTLALLICGGLALLAVGGDCVVRGGVGVARAWGLSPLFVGIVLLGFGTSLPELATSVESVRVGSPDVAVGNVVGSNIANILLIIGVAATLSAASVDRRLLWRNGLAMTGAVGLFAAALFYDIFDWRVGAAFVALLGVYLLVSALGRNKRDDAQALVRTDERSPLSSAAVISLGIFAIGLAATLAGAFFLVEGAVALAREADLPEALIGATVVAIGTSVPELATTVAAAWRGRSNLAVGNVLGSNIFNSLGIIGVATFFGDISTPPNILTLDLWVMIGASLLFLLLAASGGRITRGEGVFLLAAYAFYLFAAASAAI